MAKSSARWGFLRSRPALVLSLALMAQAALFYGYSRGESAPAARPLAESPAQFGDWKLGNVGVIEQETLDVLRADDVLTRTYAESGTRRLANLFVAYFKTQRTGQAPHSPKNCLPGSGWSPSTSDVIPIPVSGQEAPIQVNRYIVQMGDQKSVVLYWYQTPKRVIASEFEAKYYLVLDSIRYRRSDTALVRVVTPVINGDEDAATKAAIRFVQSFFTPLREYLPS
jgi:EpsI family protein